MKEKIICISSPHIDVLLKDIQNHINIYYSIISIYSNSGTHYAWMSKKLSAREQEEIRVQEQTQKSWDSHAR